MMILGYIGAVLMIVGWIWAAVEGFKRSGSLWGILNLIAFFQSVVGIISALFKKISWTPVILMILGSILSFAFGGTAIFNFL